MSMTFTKLFSSITESTVWCEPDSTRLCWITMLAMADRKGRVWASIPGLANRARVSIDDCQTALETFLSPDKFSRTSDHEGRRIAPIDGGWELLNYKKYRAVRDEETVKESKRKYINSRREAERKSLSPVENVDQSRPLYTQAEAEAEAEAEAVKDKRKRSGHFVPPSLEEVKAYVAEIGSSIDPVEFFNHYEASNWFRGKTKISKWKACIAIWNRGKNNKPQIAGQDYV